MNSSSKGEGSRGYIDDGRRRDERTLKLTNGLETLSEPTTDEVGVHEGKSSERESHDELEKLQREKSDGQTTREKTRLTARRRRWCSQLSQAKGQRPRR